MSIFKKTLKLGLSVVALPFEAAKDVVSSGTWNLFKETHTPGSTSTPFATLDVSSACGTPARN